MVDIPILQQFFMWCTILNFGILIITSLFLAVAGDFVYWIQSKFFTISREAFDTVVYSWIALYKIVVIAFSLVPWLALEIIG